MISITQPRWPRALVYYVALPLMVSAGVAVSQLFRGWGLSTTVLLIVAGSWIVTSLKLQRLLLLLLVFVLPFSWEVHVTRSIVINMPSEPMLAVLLISIGWECMRIPGTLKQLLSGETRWTMPLLACYLLFTVFSEMKAVSVKFTLVAFAYIATFFVWQKYQFRCRPALFIRLISLYSLAVIVIYGYALWQYHGYEWNPVTTKGIFKPFFKDHTIFGAVTAILAVFWLFMTRMAKTNAFRLIYLVTAIIFLSAVIVSHSRASFLSLLFSGVVGLLFAAGIRIKVLLASMAAILMFILLLNRQLFTLLEENTHWSSHSDPGYLERIKSSANVSSDASNLERLNRWVSGLNMFYDKPATGFGPGTYQFTYLPYQHPAFMTRLSVKDPWHIPENSGGTAHSEYILALSEMGLPGLIALLLVISRWLWLAFRHSYKLKDNERIMVQMAFVALSTYLFHAFFNNFLNSDKFAFLFWGFAAWMSSVYESNIIKQHGVL